MDNLELSKKRAYAVLKYILSDELYRHILADEATAARHGDSQRTQRIAARIRRKRQRRHGRRRAGWNSRFRLQDEQMIDNNARDPGKPVSGFF
jgi:hypothetical protein